jgi:hypothetical protein
MGSRTSIKHSVFTVLSDGKPKAKDVVASVSMKEYRIWNGLSYWWKKGLLLRSEKPTFESTEVFRGRGGLTRNTRAYYLYVLKPYFYWHAHFLNLRLNRRYTFDVSINF